MVSHIKTAGDKKLLLEEEKRYEVEQEVERYRIHGFAQESYIKHLQELLRKNNISFAEYRSPSEVARYFFYVSIKNGNEICDEVSVCMYLFS